MGDNLELGIQASRSEPLTSCVEVVENRVYFYGVVNKANVLQLNKTLKALALRMVYKGAINDLAPGGLYLHLNSPGGYVTEALAAVDTILNLEVPVTTIVDGFCGSAGTLLSIVGRPRLMGQNSFMLIHQLSAGSWGKIKELKEDFLNQELLMATVRGLYLKYTKIPPKKLDEILDHDLYLDAKTCLKFGLVDQIIIPTNA